MREIEAKVEEMMETAGSNAGMGSKRAGALRRADTPHLPLSSSLSLSPAHPLPPSSLAGEDYAPNGMRNLKLKFLLFFYLGSVDTSAFALSSHASRSGRGSIVFPPLFPARFLSFLFDWARR